MVIFITKGQSSIRSGGIHGGQWKRSIARKNETKLYKSAVGQKANMGKEVHKLCTREHWGLAMVIQSLNEQSGTSIIAFENLRRIHG